MWVWQCNTTEFKLIWSMYLNWNEKTPFLWLSILSDISKLHELAHIFLEVPFQAFQFLFILYYRWGDSYKQGDGHKCLCVQVSEEAAWTLADKLGLKEKPEGTEQLFQEMSEIEKLDSGKGERMKSAVTSLHLRSTRSKGSSLQWSKSLNPDQPIL